MIIVNGEYDIVEKTTYLNEIHNDNKPLYLHCI